MRRTSIVAALVAIAVGLVASAQVLANGGSNNVTTKAAVHISVFASGFNNPRGLTFGPDGSLYVAEGGLGGTHSTVGRCRQASGTAAPYTGSTGQPVLGRRISTVTPGGAFETVVRGLPSSQTSAASATS